MMLREGWGSEPNITVTLFTMNKRTKFSLEMRGCCKCIMLHSAGFFESCYRINLLHYKYVSTRYTVLNLVTEVSTMRLNDQLQG